MGTQQYVCVLGGQLELKPLLVLKGKILVFILFFKTKQMELVEGATQASALQTI